MEKHRRNTPAKYQWKKTIILTPTEGNCIERLYAQYGCANISQFCKAVVYYRLPQTLGDRGDNGRHSAGLPQRHWRKTEQKRSVYDNAANTQKHRSAQ